ncbi:MAG TPA: SIMPL domain-containing protein [Vicinamibacterales bacterium]
MLKSLSSSLLVALTLAAPVAAQQPPAPPVIVTTGEGVVKQAPDRAWVTIATESHARTPQEAQRMDTDAMTSVIDKVKALGIAGDAIQTTGYNLQPEFDYANGKQTLRDYLARNQVQVRVDALAKLGDLLASAVGAGATNVSSIRFDLKDREAVEREALRRAVRDARARADAVASGAGVQIERILRIEEQRDSSSLPPRPMAMTARGGAMMAESAVPVEAGEIEIRAHVTLTAAIR